MKTYLPNSIDIKKDLLFVSIIIPCRNEEKFIGGCIDSILASDYPQDRLEILVVDGMSTDKTSDVIDTYVKEYSFVRFYENPRMIFPCAMNIAIKNASGEIILILSAHSTYEKDYISKCVKYLFEYNADNVGGKLKIMPKDDSIVAKAIALSLSHPLSSGNAYVKIGSNEPRVADTVAFGCYRKEVFEKIGLFNEDLAGSSDMDFNVRLRESGGKILLVPDIVINYYADGDLKTFWKHNFSDGVWATYVLKFKSKGYSWRHLVPLVFVSGLLSLAGLSIVYSGFGGLLLGLILFYLMADIVASFHISLREKTLKYFLYLPLAFVARHLAHGFGALFGLFLVLKPGQLWKGRRIGAKV